MIHIQTIQLLCVIILKVTQHTAYSGHMGQIFSTELMVEICSRSLVRAIGKVLLIKLGHQLKPIKVMKMAFVCKQTAAMVVRINNIGQ